MGREGMVFTVCKFNVYLDQAAVIDFPDLFDELGQEVRAGVVE